NQREPRRARRRRARGKRRLQHNQAGASAPQRRNQLAAIAASQVSVTRSFALANGKTQQEIAAACKGVRPNHIGIAIARHKRAGRIEERDGKLYATRSDEDEYETLGVHA